MLLVLSLCFEIILIICVPPPPTKKITSNRGYTYIGFRCSVRFQHRRSSYKELQYIRDGDDHGVLYFAGTSYGEHQWVNPLLAEVDHALFFCPFHFLGIFMQRVGH